VMGSLVFMSHLACKVSDGAMQPEKMADVLTKFYMRLNVFSF